MTTRLFASDQQVHRGLRGLLVKHQYDIEYLDVNDESVVHDIDYPCDYEREIQAFLTAKPNRLQVR